jgi:hypothetical protein
MAFHLPNLQRLKFVAVLSVILFSGLLPYGCNPSEEEEPLVFPSRYKYEQLDLQPTKFYVLTANSYTEIPATGNYLAYDGLLADLLDINTTEYEIEELELLDDNTVRLYAFDHLNTTVSDTTFQYAMADNVISIQIGTNSIQYLLDSDNGAVRLPLLTLHHSKRLGPANVDYSPMDVSIELPGEVASRIQQQRSQFDLQAGDTVAVNNSSYRYPKQ